MNDQLRSLLDDVREYLDRFKDYRLIVGPPHKNDAWELMDRIDALRASDNGSVALKVQDDPPLFVHGTEEATRLVQDRLWRTAVSGDPVLRVACIPHGVFPAGYNHCPICVPDSAPACDHRGHPDWIPVPKPTVAAAKKFCTDCGQYLRPPETAAYGYSLDTEVCWHGEPKALCPQCAGDQWMIPAGKPEAWGAANDQEALLHAIEACTRSRPNDGRRWAMWPAETI